MAFPLSPKFSWLLPQCSRLQSHRAASSLNEESAAVTCGILSEDRVRYLWQAPAVRYIIKEAKDADFFRWSLAGINYQKGIHSETFDFFLSVHLGTECWFCLNFIFQQKRLVPATQHSAALKFQAANFPEWNPNATTCFSGPLGSTRTVTQGVTVKLGMEMVWTGR